MYDVAIIGTGAAGLSSALTLKQLNKDFIWFGSKKLSFKITQAEKITNYPGLISVSGKEMQEVFLKQIEDANISITEKQVTGVYQMSGYYSILCGDEMFEAKSVILALGVESVKPLKGELDLVGMGISYCATCDGMLYKGKEMTVFSTSKEFEEEIDFLASIASHVNVLPLYKDYDLNKENITILSGMPEEVKKEGKKMHLVFKDKDIESDVIFMLKSAVSPSVLVPGIEALNGHIVIDRSCKTNMEGIFAAGDCTGRPYQYTKAVGEGNISAHSAVSYLASLKK